MSHIIFIFDLCYIVFLSGRREHDVWYWKEFYLERHIRQNNLSSENYDAWNGSKTISLGFGVNFVKHFSNSGILIC